MPAHGNLCKIHEQMTGMCELIPEIYKCAQNSNSWPFALNSIAGFLDVEAVAVIVRDARNRLTVLHRSACQGHWETAHVTSGSPALLTPSKPRATKDVLDELLAHIRTALHLNQQSALFGEVLSHLALGLRIVDTNGHCILSNDEYRRHLRRFPSLEEVSPKIRPVDEILIGPNSVLNVETASLVSNTCVFHALLSRENPTSFGKEHGLTKSEAEIVALISQGLTNKEISSCRNRSIATINSQVKAILSKTHSRNRTELVRKMGRGVWP